MPRFIRALPRGRGRGITLPELIISVAIFSIAALGFISSFQYITQSLRVSRSKTIATNLAQEKIEVLKNIPYYSLMLSTQSGVDNNVSPPIWYDVVNYPPEIISIAGITFTRYTDVSLAVMTNNVASSVSYSYPDSGLKQMVVYVVWSENGQRKVFSLTNLLENPNVNATDSSISGTVNSSLGGPLASAKVVVTENPVWSALTNSAGNYSFNVYHGTYTVQASSAGYYPNTSSVMNIAGGTSYTAPTLALTQIATGTYAGNLWMNTGLVISQVVASTRQAENNNFVAQYIELFNPTTYTITIGGATPPIKVNFQAPPGCSNTDTCADATYGIKLNYVNAAVPAASYYLIANTNTITLNGVTQAADAIVADTADTFCGNPPNNNLWDLGQSPPKKQILDTGHGGSVWLTDSSGNVIDRVGWIHNANSPPQCETSCVNLGSQGLADGFSNNSNQIVRISSPASSVADAGITVYGRAYDSNNNPNDLIYYPVIDGYPYGPRSTAAGAFPVLAGKPAVGAYVTSSDPYSGSTQTYASYISSGTLSLLYAPYRHVGITTGSWTVDFSTSGYWVEIPTVTIAQGAVTWVPNATSTPSWVAAGNYGLNLTSGSVQGFLNGIVTNITGQNLSGIVVQAGGTQKTTASNGQYFMMVASGPITAIYNFNNSNPNYITETHQPVITQGNLTTQNVILTAGGTLTGYITSGTSALPNIVVVANISGTQYGAGTSDITGSFYIRNIATGTYTVMPSLSPGQSSSPSSVSAVVTAATTVDVGTFTITGAMGTLSGTVTMNGASLTSGALVVASTATIPTSPPTIVASSAAASNIYYSVSSLADGTYSLPLVGPATYNLSIFVPTVDSTGTNVSISTKTYSGINITAGAFHTQNITLP